MPKAIMFVQSQPSSPIARTSTTRGTRRPTSPRSARSQVSVAAQRYKIADPARPPRAPARTSRSTSSTPTTSPACSGRSRPAPPTVACQMSDVMSMDPTTRAGDLRALGLTSMSERRLVTGRSDGIADVRLTRAEKRNTLDRAHVPAASSTLASRWPPTVRCGWWCCRVRARRSAPDSTRRCSRRWGRSRPTRRRSAPGGVTDSIRVDAVRAVRSWTELARPGDRGGARRRGRRWLPARARCRPPHRRTGRAAGRVRDQVGDRARHVRHAAAATARAALTWRRT